MGVEEPGEGLAGDQGLAELPDISRAAAAVDDDHLVVSLNDIAVVAVAEDLPGTGGNLLRLEIGLVHGLHISLVILHQNVMERGEIQCRHTFFPLHRGLPFPPEYCPVNKIL